MHHFFRTLLVAIVSCHLFLAPSAYGASTCEDFFVKKEGFSAAWDNYKSHRQKHFNKYQIVKFVIINSALYSAIGVPLYFPSLDYSQLSPKIQKAIQRAPYIMLLTLTSFAGYSYVTDQIQKQRYEFSEENSIPIESQLYLEWKNTYQELNGRVPDIFNNKSDREEWDFIQRVTYRVWVDQFFQENSRYPDLTNPSDLGSWNSFLSKMDFQ